MLFSTLFSTHGFVSNQNFLGRKLKVIVDACWFDFVGEYALRFGAEEIPTPKAIDYASLPPITFYLLKYFRSTLVKSFNRLPNFYSGVSGTLIGLF
jgi:hypothetical protein